MIVKMVMIILFKRQIFQWRPCHMEDVSWGLYDN